MSSQENRSNESGDGDDCTNGVTTAMTVVVVTVTAHTL